MSTISSVSNSPASIHAEPLHDPSRAAQVVVPQAPLGNAPTNGKLVSQQPGMGAKALLAKKMAKGSNPKFVSPTDNMLTPCSQKISAAKKKRFDKGTKPQGDLFQSTKEESNDSESDEERTSEPGKKTSSQLMEDPENPF